MKKIMNSPETFEDDTLQGIIAAYGDKLGLLEENKRVLYSKYPADTHKVGIVTGGGSGHLPVFLGYVGQGLLDACAVGNVFASPSARTMADAITKADRGSGVLCLYGNYGGDRLNFDMACEMADMDDIKTETVIVSDDVASSPAEKADKRRGVAGMVYAFKIAGAAADQGMSLHETAEVTKRALSSVRTIGVALTPCIVPRVGTPGFSIADDEMEVGMGIHGEKGISVEKMMTADETAGKMFNALTEDMPLERGDEISIMINGLGGTPLEEQFIVYRAVCRLAEQKGVVVIMPHIGEFATSMEMAGLSVTIIKLDKELKELLLRPAKSPFYTNCNK
ncbi:dihydroxyacetone kinase subunit DhaK [[Clostridium] hylemonae]|uniref:dihydroxyacetone kinase subunit DhaK n=1 Tax=[Clostridium] hylemonae TaxID=89153 RepID=UPI001FCCA8CC|nr:dihydroxyacetone kinase subunit DhaK [[Clostridium] hylemonae]BDF02960.1 dihydroxyacetone kinase [[Clostridium] hylemonae]